MTASLAGEPEGADGPPVAPEVQAAMAAAVAEFEAYMSAVYPDEEEADDQPHP